MVWAFIFGSDKSQIATDSSTYAREKVFDIKTRIHIASWRPCWKTFCNDWSKTETRVTTSDQSQGMLITQWANQNSKQKHAKVAKRGKICNLCQARENARWPRHGCFCFWLAGKNQDVCSDWLEHVGCTRCCNQSQSSAHSKPKLTNNEFRQSSSLTVTPDTMVGAIKFPFSKPFTFTSRPSSSI